MNSKKVTLIIKRLLKEENSSTNIGAIKIANFAGFIFAIEFFIWRFSKQIFEEIVYALVTFI